MAWNIILPNLLFHTKPHPTSISWHHFNPKGTENVSFPTDTKPSGMDTVPNKQTTSISRQPPEDTSSTFPQTLLPRPHVILTQTTLCFYTTVRTWSKNLKNIIDKSVDGSCWENWMISVTLFSLRTHFLMPQCFAPLLCYSFFYIPKWNKKGKIHNKIITSRSFWNTKFCEFCICTWIYSKQNCHSYMKLLTHFCNKYNYIYHQT